MEMLETEKLERGKLDNTNVKFIPYNQEQNNLNRSKFQIIE